MTKSEWSYGLSPNQWAFPLYVSWTLGAVVFVNVHLLCFYVSYEGWSVNE